MIYGEKNEEGRGPPDPGGGVATLPGCVFPKVKDMGRFAA